MPHSPLTTTLIQSTLLNALSNLLAQLLSQYKDDTKKHFTLNTLALLQFITYGILIVPINMAWQRWLEVTFPGFLIASTLTTSTTSSSQPPSSTTSLPLSVTISTPAAITGSTSSTSTTPPPNPGSDIEVIEVKEKLIPVTRTATWKPAAAQNTPGRRVLNFLMKFLLDQTAGGILNIVLFVVLINLLKGVSLGGCLELVKEDLKPIMIARLKYRPVVSTLMYTVIPLEKRVVFGSACGVVWGVYLSLYAAV
ncbi:hypothetical protein BDW59DRAFT_141247 [Aspergillus cavernicola]|uniref:Uncharacterized protein n=1 Tax=Aspergillus cavernicola TaxID=176166 RepID=A0ABR4IR10_9EURO